MVLNLLKYFVVLDYNVTWHICLCRLFEGTLDCETNSLLRVSEVWPATGLFTLMASRLSLSGVERHGGLPRLSHPPSLPFALAYRQIFLYYCLVQGGKEGWGWESKVLPWSYCYSTCHPVNYPWTPPGSRVYHRQTGALREPGCADGSGILLWGLGTVVSFSKSNCIYFLS